MIERASECSGGIISTIQRVKGQKKVIHLNVLGVKSSVPSLCWSRKEHMMLLIEL
jgi:hypothetical protein